MEYPTLAPEINSALMYGGAGSRPLFAAAQAWDSLAAELSAAAASFEATTSALAGAAWQGAASAAMLAAAAPYTGWLSAVAANAEAAAAQARVAAAAFEAALQTTVPPAVVAANRTQFVSLVTSNWLGINAPAIASAEAAYEQMWAQDVAAMAGYYSGASAAASGLTAFTSPLQALGPRAFLESTGINFGFGDVGRWNVGSGSVGSFNVGDGNVGGFNVGLGNLGDSNVG
ncbi:PPE family protein, partial [Mycobacterium bourgelatii]